MQVQGTSCGRSIPHSSTDTVTVSLVLITSRSSHCTVSANIHMNSTQHMKQKEIYTCKTPKPSHLTPTDNRSHVNKRGGLDTDAEAGVVLLPLYPGGVAAAGAM
jgi:hypothetical protein